MLTGRDVTEFSSEGSNTPEEPRMAYGGVLDGDNEPSGEVPYSGVLDCVRLITEMVIEASGGNEAEADELAQEMLAYVDFGWISLGLRVLVRDAEAWEAHLVREVYRRWLARLQRLRGRWAAPVAESLARMRFFCLIDAAEVAPDDRALLDHIYVHGFSVEQTAKIFGLERSELVRRLRDVWAAIRQHATVFAEA